MPIRPPVRLAWELLGPERFVLATDAMQATGLGEGIYILGDREVFVGPEGPRIGRSILAGSTLTMDQAVANLHRLDHGHRGPGSRLCLDQPGTTPRPGGRELMGLLEEIREQPEVIARTTAVNAEPARRVAGLASDCTHAVIAARGTSDNAGTVCPVCVGHAERAFGRSHHTVVVLGIRPSTAPRGSLGGRDLPEW